MHIVKRLTAGFVFAVLAAGPSSAQSTDWSGHYIGAHFGTFGGETHFATGPGAPAFGYEGEFIGLVTGYDWQFDRLIAGVVGQYAIADVQAARMGTCGVGCSSDIERISSLRGRVGYAFDRVMVHASAGVAQIQVYDFVNGAAFTQTSDQTGQVFGLGAEVMVGERNSIGIEFSSYTFDPYIAPITTRITPNGLMTVTLGFNMRF